LAEAGLGRGAWEATLKEVQTLAGVHSEEIENKVKRLRSGLKKFLDSMRASEATDVARLEGLSSLHSAFDNTFGDLVQRFAGTVLREVDDLIEQESEELKLILFIFVTEAVRNAFVHGKTTKRVEVKIIRDYVDILTRVSDDGEGFDPHCAIPGPDGIFSIDKMGQEFLGAQPIDWTGTAPGRGTTCTWTIPALPEPRALLASEETIKP
jgi:glucose-6-phosphate-specific signal transduction histidine kinase